MYLNEVDDFPSKIQISYKQEDCLQSVIDSNLFMIFWVRRDSVVALSIGVWCSLIQNVPSNVLRMFSDFFCNMLSPICAFSSFD